MKIIKTIQDFTPWYLRPSHLIEVIPEIIKDKSNSKIKDSDSKKEELKPTKEFKVGLEELIYGIGLLVFFLILRSYL